MKDCPPKPGCTVIIRTIWKGGRVLVGGWERGKGGCDVSSFGEDWNLGLSRQGKKKGAFEFALSVQDSQSVFLDRKNKGLVINLSLTSGTSSAFGFLRISHSTVTGVSGLRAIPARMLCWWMKLMISLGLVCSWVGDAVGESAVVEVTAAS